MRIAAAAAEMGYHPNPQARSLTSGRTQSIALLIPDVTNPYFFGLIRGTQSQARAHGHRLLLVDTEESAEVEAAVVAELRNSVDGIVAAASRRSDEQLLEVKKGIPMVVINREIPGVPSVVIDTAMGVVQAVEHLASLGHTKIAYLAGPISSWSNRTRWRALSRAAKRLNIDCIQIGPFSPTMEAGAAAADAAVHQGVTACIFFNDLLAIGALGRFAERGIQIPTGMSVVGCDDIFGADFCHPPLTTITAPIEQAGRVAIDMLLSSLSTNGLDVAPTRSREILSTHLTIRESTGPRES